MPASTAIKWHETTEFRDIPGFPGYRAGSDGTIWSCLKPAGSHWRGDSRQEVGDKWKMLNPELRKKDGRARHTLRHSSGKMVRRYRSHFVLFAFFGPRTHGTEACHDDGNCTNDRADNLRWDTPTANKADMVRHGTRLSGEDHPKSKVTDAQADEIKARRAAGEKLASIARDFAITMAAVSFIANGKRKNRGS